MFYYIVHNRTGNLGYGTCSKYLTYSIESQVVGFGIQASMWNPFLVKQLSLGYREKSVMERNLSKSSSWREPIKSAPYKDSD